MMSAGYWRESASFLRGFKEGKELVAVERGISVRQLQHKHIHHP
jgi:hypothetical protein